MQNAEYALLSSELKHAKQTNSELQEQIESQKEAVLRKSSEVEGLSDGLRVIEESLVKYEKENELRVKDIEGKHARVLKEKDEEIKKGVMEVEALYQKVKGLNEEKCGLDRRVNELEEANMEYAEKLTRLSKALFEASSYRSDSQGS